MSNFEINIWYPGCEEGPGYSTEEIIERLSAIQLLIQRKMPPDTFLDLLDAQGFDVYAILDNWEAQCFQ